MKYYLCCCLLLCSLGLASQEFPIRQTYDLYSSGQSFSCSDGDIIFWSDNSSSHWDIYAQKIPLAGGSLWPDNLLLYSAPGDQVILGGVTASDGNYILLMGDKDREGFSRSFLLKINPNAAMLWAPGGVEVPIGGLLISKAFLVPNSCGGAYVAYNNPIHTGVVQGQNYDVDGNPLWEDGRLIATHTSSLELSQAISDGEGGMILNLKKMVANSPQSHLLRLDTTGTQIGSNPLVNPNVFQDKLFDIVESTLGHFILWQIRDYEDYGNFVRFRKIDSMGNLLGGNTTHNFPAGWVTQDYILRPTADGGIAFLWEGWSIATPVDLKLIKLSSTFQQQWVVDLDGTESSSWLNVAGKQMETSPSGRIWLTWIQERVTGGYANVAQLISPEGELCWENGGIELNPPGFCNLLLVQRDTRGLYICSNYSDSQHQIRYQDYDDNGVSNLPGEGVLIVESLCGRVEKHQMLAVGDKYFVSWQEDFSERNLCYQILDQAQNCLLEPEGRVLPDAYIFWDWIPVGDNQVAFLLERRVGESHYTYLQCVDTSGNYLYPEPGIQVEHSSEFGVRELRLASLNGDLYVSWIQSSSDYSAYEIRAQRYSGGIACWEPNGKILLSCPSGNGGITFYNGFTGEYLLWGRDFGTLARAVRYDSEGNPDPAWEPGGVELIAIPMPDPYYPRQEVMDFGFDGEALIVRVKTTIEDSEDIRLQKISPQGQRLWTDQGYTVVTPGSGSKNPDIVYGNTTSYLYQDPSDPAQRLLLQRVNAQGLAVFEGEVREIQSGLHELGSAKLFHFADGNWLCAWSDTDGLDPYNRDIFSRRISSEGLPLDTAASIVCNERYPQDVLEGAVIGDNLLLTWKDYRTGVLPDERVNGFPGLWARYLSSQGSAGEDPSAPVPILTLRPNYPNPFNPSTSISFSLAVSGVTSLEIYNLRGQLVRRLLSDESLPAGEHLASWDGRDESQRVVSTGIYYYRLSQGGVSATRRMVMIK